MNSLSNAIIRYRLPIISVFVLITLLLARQIPNAGMNMDMLTYMPETMESRLNKDRIEEIFGGTEMIMVLLKTDDVLGAATLERVRAISRRMKRIRGVDDVMSVPLHPYTEALLSAVPQIDAASRREVIRLEGDMPSPANPPSGCHFHPRCPRAADICRHQYPEMRESGPARQVACHFAN